MFDGFLIVTLFHHETSPQKIPFQCSIFLMVKGTHSSTPTPADFSIFHDLSPQSSEEAQVFPGQ